MIILTLCVVLACLCPPKSQAFADECPAGGEHSYSVTLVRQASEYETGLKIFTCMKCGYSYEHVTDPSGHVWTPWVRDVEPTCLSEGSEYRTCERHQDNPHSERRSVARLSPTGDHVMNLVEQKNPTCTEAGWNTYACEYCGTSYTDELAATGHAWGDWVVETEATTTQEGQKVRRCAHDETHVEYESIPRVAEKEASEQPTTDVQKPYETNETQQVSVTDDNENNDLSSFTPNAIDAAAFTLDLLVLGVLLFLLIPIFARLRWTEKKAQETFDDYIESIEQKDKRP